MSVDALLSHLNGARKTGSGRWLARCPAHEDRRPSLSIRECDDGKVLINCLAGCGALQVLNACGLDYDALFPPKPIGTAAAMRRPVFASDVFELIRFEIGVVHLIACDLHKSKTISEQDYQRLRQSIAKLKRIGSLAYGS
jgi:hypothetical protein